MIGEGLLRDILMRITGLQRRMGVLETRELGYMHYIAESVLTVAAASVTFSSIPQYYRSLQLVASIRTTRSSGWDYVLWRANADSGNNYDWVYWYGYGDDTRGANAGTGGNVAWIGMCEGDTARANNFAPFMALWPNYASTTAEKRCLGILSAQFGGITGVADLGVMQTSSLWRSTSAITSLTLLPSTGPNFKAGSIFTLYGVQ